MQYFYVIAVFMLFFVGISLDAFQQNSAHGQSNELVFSITDNPYNNTFTYWVDKWFDWFLSLPNVEGNEMLMHPRDNYSPEKCSWNQDDSSPVWMLPDGRDSNDLTEVEMRECSVPSGKALLVQIVGSNCSEEEGLKNDKDIMECATWVLPQAQFSATVDGKEVMNTITDPSHRDKFYVKPFFANITYAKSNYYGASEGTYRGAEAGIFLFVKPLPIGNHTIQFQESVINTLDSTGNDKRISNVQYNMVIENSTK